MRTSTLYATGAAIRQRHIEDPSGRCDSCRLPWPCPPHCHASEVVEAAGVDSGVLEGSDGGRPPMDAGPRVMAAAVEEQLSAGVFGRRLGDPSRCRVAGTWER